MMFPMTYGQHQLVYNFTSFTLASMMACTVFFWLRLGSVAEQYKTALVITGLVTFIAFYHYARRSRAARPPPTPLSPASPSTMPTGTLIGSSRCRCF